MPQAAITNTIKKETGNYILVLYNEQPQKIEVGKLGTVKLKKDIIYMLVVH